MEIVDVLVAALAAGAAVGITDAASTAMKDTYQGMKSLTGKLLRRRRDTGEAELEEQLANPRSHRDALAAALAQADEGEREQLKAAAERFLGMVGAVQPTYQNFVVRDSPNSAIGPNGAVTNITFHRA